MYDQDLELDEIQIRLKFGKILVLANDKVSWIETRFSVYEEVKSDNEKLRILKKEHVCYSCMIKFDKEYCRH